MERAKGTSALDTYSAVLPCAWLLCTVAAFNRRCTRRSMAWWGRGAGGGARRFVQSTAGGVRAGLPSYPPTIGWSADGEARTWTSDGRFAVR